MSSVVCEERFLDTLVQISSLITAGQDREKTFSKVLSCALEVLDAEAVFLIAFDGSAIVKYAKRRHDGGVEGAMEKYEHAGDRGIVRWVMMEGRPVIIPKVSEEPRFEEVLRAEVAYAVHSKLERQCSAFSLQSISSRAIHSANRTSAF
jgi:transcriptional regulator with GAF, ATPase, and Fis domain